LLKSIFLSQEEKGVLIVTEDRFRNLINVYLVIVCVSVLISLEKMPSQDPGVKGWMFQWCQTPGQAVGSQICLEPDQMSLDNGIGEIDRPFPAVRLEYIKKNQVTRKKIFSAEGGWDGKGHPVGILH
jgi:hypothetical protein